MDDPRRMDPEAAPAASRRMEAVVAALSRPLLDALREWESRQERVNESQEILGKPQQLLNLTLILETYVQLITSWLGALAIVWATVVILGSFSTVLAKKDFWFTTAIVFIEATKIVGWGPKANFFLHLPGAVMQRGKLLWSRNPINIAGQFTVVALLINLLAPILQATSFVTLPIIRLVSLARHDYVDTFIDPRKGNVRPALIFFYALVLTQGALLLHLFLISVDRSLFTKILRSHYFKDDDKEGEVFVNRYVAYTLATCIQNGVLSTANRTLVLFATELLQSININDHVSAVSVLRTLIKSVKPDVRARLVKEIYSSEELVGRLVKLISPRSLIQQDTKLCVAEIFVKLGRNVRLADIPGAAMSISSLIDASLIETAELKNFDWKLFIHGFQILDELAANPENCIEMCSMTDVVSRIIAPVNHGLHMIIEHDPDTAKILKGSLSVVARLTSGTGEACRNLRRQISENHTVISNMISILRKCTDEDMNMHAAEILSRLNLGEENMHLFLPNIEHLVTVINSDGSSNDYRAVAAELLTQVCEKAQNGIDLQHVSNSLPMILKTTINNIQNANPKDIHRTRFLASLLGLAVQICCKLPMITAGKLFTQAVMAIPMDNNLAFVETLVEIIQTSSNNDSKHDVVCLAVVKATAKLAIWMVERNEAAYLQHFQQVNILEKLEAAVEAMHHLDRYVILTRRGDGNQYFETLRSVVRNATDIVWPPPAAAAPEEQEQAQKI